MWCPVRVFVPRTDCGMGVRLRDASTGKAVPCQVERSKDGVWLWWLVQNLKAGEVQTLRAEPAGPASVSGVALEDDVVSGKLNVLIHGKPFTSYHYGPQWVRPFLHPLLGPGDVPVTRGWPVAPTDHAETRDHAHHKSLWVAHGDCSRVDNWSEEPGHGWQVHQRFLARDAGPVWGRVAAKNAWTAANGRKQSEELREFRFYALPNGERLFDMAVSFRMTERDVTFRDTKEGGLVSVRVATSMDVRNGGRIENAYGGINEAETWGKKAPWCDYSGDVDGHRVGVAVMDHPDNPRYPTEWHVRDYGLMTANCFGWRQYRPERKEKGDMTLRKGSTTQWRYRLFVHKGDAAKGKVGQRFMDYIAPPAVTVE